MSTPKRKSIGRYDILEELGRGAMGVVYRAQDPMLDRQLAIKTIVIPANDSDRLEYEARFTQEARAAGKLAHPGIVTIYDVGREGDSLYIAMELLEGVDLAVRAQQQPFGIVEAVQIAAQVADALAFAHERGVVHRDIKPPNIMLLEGGRVKIMDFGRARMRQSDVKTQTGLMLGTPRYMSPEQIAGKPADHRSDIFSLGTVLYEMLTATKLFAGGEATEIMYNVANVRPIAPSRINRRVPAMLDLVVAKAQEKSADERYQDARQLTADLRACLVELGSPQIDPDSTQRQTGNAAASTGDDRTDTLPMGPDGQSAAAEATSRNRPAKPVNVIVDSNTRLGLSSVFDSSLAVKRLAEPDPKDLARLTRIVRSGGAFARSRLRSPTRRSSGSASAT